MDFNSKSMRSIIISMAIAVFIYAAFALATDVDKVWNSFLQIGLLGWFGVMGLALVNYGFRFIRWNFYLGRFDCDVPLFQHIAYYIAGFAFTATPGKAGEAVRSIYLINHGVAYRHSLAAFFSERLVDVVVLVLLSISLILVFDSAVLSILAAACILVVVFLLIHSSRLFGFMEWLKSRFTSERIHVLIEHTSTLLRTSAELLTTFPMCVGLVLGLIGWTAECLGFFLILYLLGVDISVALAVGIYAFALLVGAVSFIPGGLGSTEATMMLLLSINGIETDVSTSAIVIVRVATLWFAVLMGLGAVSWLGFGTPKKAI